MSLGSHRLLGFAFANADLLVEVDARGRIAFAIGAGETLSGSTEATLVGRLFSDFVDPRDRPMVTALFDGLDMGMRGGPLLVALVAPPGVPRRAASLSACRLPQNEGAVSCTLSRAAAVDDSRSIGLQDKAGFEATAAGLLEAARTTGAELELALVEIHGLSAAKRALTPGASKSADQRVAGLLRANAHGSAAADLGGDRYALVRRRDGEDPDRVAQRIVKLMALDPSVAVTASASAVSLAGDATAGQALRAIRYSLDSFIRDGVPDSRRISLSDAVAQSMRRTLLDVSALNEAVADRRFTLAYQPVVDLRAGGALHHYEALVRFGDNASPFPLIRMAEELDLIEPLDMAIVERAVKVLSSDPSLSLAVNISGRTIGSSRFIGGVQALIAANPDVRSRLMIELTESAAIDDLALADRHLQVLRSEGCQVCLDDFGAGAASLAYLQQLSLDVVKIDGRYIRELQHGGRESTFIRHLVTMCGELGVKTLAEMVETPQVEEAVRRAGVDFAQGWLYGAAVETPTPPADTALTRVTQRARRVGVTEGWG